MAITIELPDVLERQLRIELSDLDQIAKEAALVELYRRQSLTRHQLGTALNLDRLSTDGLLKRHHVTEDLLTIEQFNRQSAALRELLGE